MLCTSERGCSQKSSEHSDKRGVLRTKEVLNERRILSCLVRHRRMGNEPGDACAAGTVMKYASPGFRSVEASSNRAAAAIFAERAARKRYGRSGYCRTCKQVAHSKDGTFAEYIAFIGRTLRGQRSETAGHNQSFVVYAAKAFSIYFVAFCR
jgi:hypothetical protein